MAGSLASSGGQSNVSLSSTLLSAQDWAARHRTDDGEQQPVSPVEREFGLESQSRRHGLELIEPLMARLGNPQLRYPTIHVTGSKGKGSTVAILSAILRAAGLRVGSYTSPSLTQFGERIQVNDRNLRDSEAERCLAELRPALASFAEPPRFFEAATAVAFLHFAHQAVDVAVIEVGIGGGRDATNVVQPEVAVITSIELEHTHILGDTLGAIATEKAGIIKRGVPTVTAVDEPEPFGPIRDRCAALGAPLARMGREFDVSDAVPDRTGQRFDLWLSERLGGARFPALRLALAGEAQPANAAMAVAAARLLAAPLGPVSEAAIRRGLSSTRWPGRLELREGRPAVLLDVAHTPASARQLRRYTDRFFPGVPRTLVIGMLREKNAAALAGELGGAFDSVVVAPVKWFRSMDCAALEQAFRGYGASVAAAPSICRGVELALAATPSHGLVVVAGSVFAVGEAKRRFGWV